MIRRPPHLLPTVVSVPLVRPLPIGDAGWARASAMLKLPPQQSRIVELLLRGKRDKQIAHELGLTLPTVRTYLARIFVRVGVTDRVELILHVVELACLGTVPPGHQG